MICAGAGLIHHSTAVLINVHHDPPGQFEPNRLVAR